MPRKHYPQLYTWRRITKRDARLRFYAGKPIALLSCNLRPGMMWQPCPIDPVKCWEHAAILDRSWDTGWTPDDATQELKEQAWDQMYNNWAWYNTDYERGYYAHYYVKTPRPERRQDNAQ